MDPLDFHVKHPTTIHVSRLTRCNKTKVVRRMLEEQLIQPFATRIVWVFSEWQLDYDIMCERTFFIYFEQRWRDEIFDLLRAEQRNILLLND